MWTDSELNNYTFDKSGHVINHLCTCVNPERANDFNAGADIFIAPAIRHVRELTDNQNKVFFRGTVANLSCFNVAAVSYGHWLTDVLPRLALFLDKYNVKDIDYFYFPSIRWPWQIETMRLLGIKIDRVISEEKVKFFSCDMLLSTPFPRPAWDVPNWIPKALKKLFRVERPDFFSQKKFFYATRKDAKWRKVKNETALEQALTKAGFEILTLANFSLDQKIKLFAETGFVVSMHGSSLGNTLFCHEGAGVLEIFGPGQTSPLHRQIAECIQLQYRSIQFSKPLSSSTYHLDAAFEDVELDINAILANVKTGLKLCGFGV